MAQTFLSVCGRQKCPFRQLNPNANWYNNIFRDIARGYRFSDMAQKSLIHIGKQEVEKIALGGGRILYHLSDRFFINDLDPQASHGVRWRELAPGEEIEASGKRETIPRQLFFGEDRITLTGSDLFSSKTSWTPFRRKYSVFCNHISFRAEAGTLTALMGPSGAGKTVLLNLLSGYVYSHQNRSKIFITDKFGLPKFDVQRDRRLLGQTIGYVPQDDTLIPQLTVRQSLDYAFQLRYPDIDRDLKEFLIRDTCQKSGFEPGEIADLLDKRIGSPEAKTLSGGQRKRVNIAHELIRNPLLLFLDEPTSGLSSSDANTVIKSLKALCQRTQITIILTIHQPSVEAFEQFDKLFVLNKGGNIAYFGEAQHAVGYFEAQTGQQRSQHENPADFIIETLEAWRKDKERQQVGSPAEKTAQACQAIASIYRKNPHYFELTERFRRDLQQAGVPTEILRECEQQETQCFFWPEGFWTYLHQRLNQAGTSDIAETVQKVIANRPANDTPHQGQTTERQPQRSSVSWLRQIGVVLRRNLAIARADTNNSIFQLVQPMIIGVLMLLAFAWYTRDFYGEDILSRMGYEFTPRWGRETITPSEDLPEAKLKAFRQPNFLSESSANRRAAVFFLLIASSIWFGVINACREIVDERAVLKREVKSTLRTSSYLLAKVAFLGWVCLKQVALLMLIVMLPNWLFGLNIAPNALKRLLVASELVTQIAWLSLFGILWLTAICASWIGLAISAFSPTQRVALTAVPLVIIPQLLLGGLIRPMKNIDLANSFMLTPGVMTKLSQQNIPDTLLTALNIPEIQNQRFLTDNDFLYAVEMASGDQPAPEIKDLLLAAASQRKPALIIFLSTFIHDLVLEKWAFQATLLYDSAGASKVLRKIVDIAQYNKEKHQYLLFETREIVELFFDPPLKQFAMSEDEYRRFLQAFPQANAVLQKVTEVKQGEIVLKLGELSARNRQKLPLEAWNWLNEQRDAIEQRERARQIAQILILMACLHALLLLIPAYTYLTLQARFASR
ncbi:ABC transporter related protein [Candidatus Moduliflexus flocculans]|uniref:ABC transporter related protein n=1 Tax=Candidatus Moduliflexus flocculans TaxID=1499966 RepID=A0A0S6VYH4_9BACT|nr:ABC transporter related protein [Candidatus Moduliflexus flocculans]